MTTNSAVMIIVNHSASRPHQKKQQELNFRQIKAKLKYPNQLIQLNLNKSMMEQVIQFNRLIAIPSRVKIHVVPISLVKTPRRMKKICRIQKMLRSS